MSKQIHDPIREDGPQEHIVKKVGTPTMGGVLILLGLFSGVLLWSNLKSPFIWFLIFVVTSFGLIGAYDDIKKIKTKNSAGISLKIKLLFQILLALIAVLILYFFADFNEIKELYFPFLKTY